MMLSSTIIDCPSIKQCSIDLQFHELTFTFTSDKNSSNSPSEKFRKAQAMSRARADTCIPSETSAPGGALSDFLFSDVLCFDSLQSSSASVCNLKSKLTLS